MALISQDCDILKPPEEFPYVEFALVLETSTPAVIREADSLTSARYFRLGDPASGRRLRSSITGSRHRPTKAC